MSLLNFHASKLYRLKRIHDDAYDDDGNFRPTLMEWEYCCDCDVVPAGEANKIAIPDGTIDFYSYNITNIPVGIKTFSYGESIKLVILGCEEAILKVKGFHRYQLQCKIWA